MKTLAGISLALLSIGNAWAGESDVRNVAAERLMIEAQARAYSSGLHCECTPKDFLYRVSPADEESVQNYLKEEFLHKQAGEYSKGRSAIPMANAS